MKINKNGDNVALNKEWYQIIAPPSLGGKTVGETPAFDPKNLVGRIHESSMMELTGSMSKFYIKVKLRVYKVDGLKAYTTFAGHEYTRDRIYRLVQRRSERVDVIKDISLKDGSKIRFKVLIILLRNTSNSINTDVRKKAEGILKNLTKNSDISSVIDGMLNGSYNRALKEEIKKIYPVGAVEIIKSKVLKEGNRIEEKPKGEEKKKEKEEPLQN